MRRRCRTNPLQSKDIIVIDSDSSTCSDLEEELNNKKLGSSNSSIILCDLEDIETTKFNLDSSPDFVENSPVLPPSGLSQKRTRSQAKFPPLTASPRSKSNAQLQNKLPQGKPVLEIATGPSSPRKCDYLRVTRLPKLLKQTKDDSPSKPRRTEESFLPLTLVTKLEVSPHKPELLEQTKISMSKDSLDPLEIISEESDSNLQSLEEYIKAAPLRGNADREKFLMDIVTILMVTNESTEEGNITPGLHSDSDGRNVNNYGLNQQQCDLKNDLKLGDCNSSIMKKVDENIADNKRFSLDTFHTCLETQTNITNEINKEGKDRSLVDLPRCASILNTSESESNDVSSSCTRKILSTKESSLEWKGNKSDDQWVNNSSKENIEMNNAKEAMLISPEEYFQSIVFTASSLPHSQDKAMNADVYKDKFCKKCLTGAVRCGNCKTMVNAFPDAHEENSDIVHNEPSKMIGPDVSTVLNEVNSISSSSSGDIDINKLLRRPIVVLEMLDLEKLKYRTN